MLNFTPREMHGLFFTYWVGRVRKVFNIVLVKDVGRDIHMFC